MSVLPPDRAGLKAMTDHLVEAVGGGLTASRILGHKSPAPVSSARSVTYPDRWLQLDDLMLLERRAQRPVVSEWLVERCLRDPERPRPTLTMEAVAHLAQEGAGAKLAVVHALADGKVCAADRRDVARELRELRDLVDTLLDAVEAW